MRIHFSILSIILILLQPGVALANDDVIGTVKMQNGPVVIVRDAKVVDAAVRMPLYEKDVVKTGAGGSVGIILKDDTVLSLGPDSELVLTEFMFAPREGKLSLVARLLRGTATFISGIIAKLAPENARLETPSATIGIRGTHVLVSVLP